MGLPRAVKAHQLGNHEEALVHYKRALEQNPNVPDIYQNFGSLLNTLNKTEEAFAIYAKGISLFPDHIGILRNYANLAIKKSPILAIEIYFSVAKLISGEEEVLENKTFQSTCIDIITFLYNHKFDSWAYCLVKSLIPFASQDFACSVYTFLVLLSDRLDYFDDYQKELIEMKARDLVANSSLLEVTRFDFALVSKKLKNRDFNDAYELYQTSINRIDDVDHIDSSFHSQIQELIYCNSWNFACLCLPLGKLEAGWKLFEYGLQTPAAGPQKWQRSLPKPFHTSDIQIWRGQLGAQVKLLLLEEQAIGDIMMFLRLVPNLFDRLGFLGIYLGPRLLPIYARSFEFAISQGALKLFSQQDLETGVLSANNFDYQSPIGSICQYQFSSFDCFNFNDPVLKPNLELANQLRTEYTNYRVKKDFLVGISWNGGGRGSRVKEKSIDSSAFSSFLLGCGSIRFVNLQYGDTDKQINEWQSLGLDIIHDKRINPLKNMDSWLSQVQACDAVLSVANTTIHGAGGLNIPTLCLLSIYSDWRWLLDENVKRSYWYPSVGIARQTVDSGWTSAFSQAKRWIIEGCPIPVGPVC